MSSRIVSRIVEPVAVELAQLGHPVAHRLRVHEQVGGDGVALALVQQPRSQRLGQSLGGVGTQFGQRRQRVAAQIVGGLAVGGQHQLDEVLVGVDDLASSATVSSRARSARR